MWLRCLQNGYRMGLELLGEDKPEQELCEFLRKRAPFTCPGYRKANTGRTVDIITTTEKNHGK